MLRQAGKQIAYCALLLIGFCVFCRLTVFRTYTANIPIYPREAQTEEQTERAQPRQDRPRAEIENPEVARLSEMTVYPDHMRLRVQPGKTGETDIRLFDEDGEEIGFHTLRVGPFGTVYDPQTEGFTGDTAVLIAVTLFWVAVSAIMLWHYFQAKGPAYYAYSTIYFAGFSIFSMVTAAVMLGTTVSHMLNPASYSMLSAYNTINGAAAHFMMLTMPLIVLFAIAMAVSNLELLRHEPPSLKNVLGLGVSVLLIAGEAIGVYLYTRDFMGSEFEGRIQNTLQNVYATVFSYFECMLAGSVICGVKAARYRPDMDKDVIIILGCWFRKDGTLPPLLKGRVDEAVSFWRRQKERTGKEALLIPSGGQGKNEPMPEAEAMKKYLIEQNIPADIIFPERQSKNTYQNMANSRKIINILAPRSNVLYATTNYHVFRSGVWAAQAGLTAVGIGGKTKWWFWPNAFMRECAGLLLKRWKQELCLLVVLIVFFGVLNMVL